MAKRKGTRLPRLTLLAYSSKDLARFSEAIEAAVQLRRDLDQVVTEARGILASLEAVAVVIERRHNAAKQANRTRADKRNGTAIGDGALTQREGNGELPNEADEAILTGAAQQTGSLMPH